MAEESKTVVTIVDETIGLSTNPVDSGVNILCPIISPNGPTELTYVSGPTRLRNYFNAGSSITASSEQTLKYARAVLNESPIYVKRASRGNLKGGSTFGKYPTTFYTDAYGNVVDGQKVTFTLNIPEDQTYDALIEDLTTIEDGDMSCIRMDETVFVAGENFINSNHSLYSTSNQFDVTNVLVFSDIDATLAGDVIVNIGSVSFTFKAGTVRDSMGDFLEEIFDDQSTINPIAIFGTGIIFNSYGTSTWGYTTSDNYTVTAIAFGSSISAVYANTEDEEIISSPEEVPEQYLPYVYTILDEDEYEDTYPLSNVDITLKYDSGSGEESIQIITDDVDSSISADYVIEVAEGTNFSDFMETVLDELGSYVTVDTFGVGKFVVVNGTTGTTDNMNDSQVQVTISNLSKPGLDVFGIVSKFPNSGKVITVALTSADVENDLYEMTVTYSGVSETWTFSFTEGAVDGYGNDINYKVVNRDSTLVEIIPIGGISAEVQTISIGNEVTGDHLGVSHLIAALEYIQEYEESSVNFDFILDGGVVDSSYSSAILTACETYCSFYPKSCPTDATTATAMSNGRGSSNSYRFNYIGATQNESILDSGLDTFPGSFYWLKRRLELANTVQEYIPLFGPTNGDIGIDSPNVVFSKTERESLLDSEIMTLRRSMSTGSYYLNDDLTCYGTDSYLQEAATVLMVNKICHVAMSYAETLKGQWNTSQLRERVTTALTNFITERLRVGTEYGPDSITVVCDDENNPQTLINQRQLRIDIYGRFNRSIKDVLIYTYVQPLED